MEQSGVLATSPGYIGQVEAHSQLIQAVVASKVESYSYTSGIPTVIIASMMAWITLGIIAVCIHKYFTHGPANPFGEQIEIQGFWILFVSGPLGFLVALYCAGDYVLEMHLIRKKGAGQISYKNTTPSSMLELFYSPHTGFPTELPVLKNKKR